MSKEISRLGTRVIQPARVETDTPRTEALRPARQPETPRDVFTASPTPPVSLDAPLPQLTSDAPVFNVGGIQTQEVVDLAAADNQEAVRALSLMSAPEAAEALLRAPASALSASDYTRIADLAGSDPAVQSELRTRVAAGDAQAMEGLSSAIHQMNPNRAVLASALAAAPAGTLTPRAYEALGKEAGAGNRDAFERLQTDARSGQAGAVQGLEAMTLHGISPSHRDQARDALATAAIENPSVMDTLRRMHERGATRREVDNVDAYFNATSRLTDPARIAAEVQHMNERGTLASFVSSVHPQRLMEGPLRGELMKVALGPPANEAVRGALGSALGRADFDASQMLREHGQSDIDRARAGVMEEIQRRAETDPDMKALSDLLQVAHRSATDPEFGARVDQDRLQQQLRELMEKPSVQQTLAEIRDQSDLFNAGDRMAERIESPAYQDQLRLMSPEERQATLARDLGQLASVDPARAQAVTAKMAAEQIASDPIGALANMPEGQRQAAIAALASDLGVPPAALGQLAQSILDSRMNRQPIPGIEQVLSSLPAGQRTALLRAFGSGANALNGVASAISAAGLVDAAMAGDVLGAVSNGSGLSASLSTLFSNSPGLLGSAARWGGVVGNGASAVLNGIASYQEAMRGDYVGAAGNGLMAAGSGVLAGSVFTGTAAPGVAVVGAALIGAGWAANRFAEEDHETLARQYGLYRP